MKLSGMLLAAALALGPSGLALSQTTTDLNNQAAKMNSLSASLGESKVMGKISNDFSSFLGSNADAVVAGLRNGTPITLTTTTTTPSATPGGAPVTTTSTTIITPPTGKMGFGEVFISLALAKQQLGQLGITQPTPQQLQAALTGGTITTNAGTSATSTTLQGILTMRSQNMGWGQIAQKLGYKLGPLISSMKSANQQMTTAGSSSKIGQSAGSSGNGIVSGSGKSHGNFAQGEKGGSGEGIVSASGRSVGNGNAYGKGIVTGAGQSGGNAGVTNAGGHGNAQGKGQAR